MNNRTKKLFALGMIISLSLGQIQMANAAPTVGGVVKKTAGTIIGGALGLSSAILLHASRLDKFHRAQFFKSIGYSLAEAIAKSEKMNDRVYLAGKG